MKPSVLVLNGWAASDAAWSLCGFRRDGVYSYRDHLDGATARAFDAAGSAILVGWSMGGSYALRMVLRDPGTVKGLVLVAATPRMMADSGWVGMTERRLAALDAGLRLTLCGGGFTQLPPDKPNPYAADTDENLARGLYYLRETDLRGELEARRGEIASIPAFIFQSERDAVVRPHNAEYLASLFAKARLSMIPGAEHALPIFIPELIDDAVEALLTGLVDGD